MSTKSLINGLFIIKPKPHVHLVLPIKYPYTVHHDLHGFDLVFFIEKKSYKVAIY